MEAEALSEGLTTNGDPNGAFCAAQPDAPAAAVVPCELPGGSSGSERAEAGAEAQPQASVDVSSFVSDPRDSSCPDGVIAVESDAACQPPASPSATGVCPSGCALPSVERRGEIQTPTSAADV